MKKQSIVWISSITVIIIAGVGIWSWLARPSLPTQTSDPSSSEQSSQPKKQLSLSFSNITAGQEVTGKVAISLLFDDISRITHAEYYVDNVFAAVTYTYPFTFNFDANAFSEGSHTITAKAYDKDGNVFTAKPVTIIVINSNSPEQTQPDNHSEVIVRRSPEPSPATPAENNSPIIHEDSDQDDDTDTSDTTAPSAPGNLMLAASDGYTTNLSWTASTDDTGVDGYQVYRDGAMLGSLLVADINSYQDQTVVPGNTYEYSVKAVDAADNLSAPSNEPYINLVSTSIWINADSPYMSDSSSDPYELGVKFRPLVNGKITGVKFYKVASSTGTHMGNLWLGDGTHLADVTFEDETATGWQQATFDTPIDVVAGTTYVVSYTAPNGGFGYTPNYFATDGITSQYLTAMASGVDGDNGVFSGTPGNFPDGSFNDTHYWVDALFVPNENAGGPSVKTLDTSKVYPGFPGSNNTGVPVGKRLPTRDRGIQMYETGAVMENIDVKGQVDVRADNILIRNSKVDGSFVYLDTDALGASAWDFTIRDTEIDAGMAQRGGVSLGNFTLERVNIHGGQMSALCGGNCNVSDSWLHGQYLPPDLDWHLGGFLSNGGSDMVVSGNTIACDTPNNLVGGGCSGDLNLFGDFSPIRNILIEDNLFHWSEGATYCLNLGYNAFKPFGPGAENIDVINNVFQRGSSGKCASVDPATDYMVGGFPAPGNSWINNKWEDGAVISPPL